MKWIGKMVLLGLLIGGCSVKEIRTECPCWLSVDLSAASAAETDIVVSIWTEDGVQTASYVPGAVDLLYEYEVRKGYCCVSTVVGMERGGLQGSRLLVPEGEPYDPLFVGAMQVDASGETASAAVRLFKQFAGVQVDFGGLLRDSPGIRLVVRGAVAGLDVTDLSPLPGPFRIDVSPDADGSCRFRLPRQLDDSLVMELWQEGALMYSYPLGEQIIAQGFDWERPDLGDVRITLNGFDLHLEVTVSDWELESGGSVTI